MFRDILTKYHRQFTKDMRQIRLKVTKHKEIMKMSRSGRGRAIRSGV